MRFVKPHYRWNWETSKAEFVCFRKVFEMETPYYGVLLTNYDSAGWTH